MGLRPAESQNLGFELIELSKPSSDDPQIASFKEMEVGTETDQDEFRIRKLLL